MFMTSHIINIFILNFRADGIIKVNRVTGPLTGNDESLF